MISLKAALGILDEQVAPLGVEMIGLPQAAGRIVAKPVIARRTQPPFAASAMDGYAVRAADLSGHETSLALVGESAAGHASHRPLAAGEAMRISTGAPVPGGADQVVIQEHVTVESGRIVLSERPQPGQNIRSAGTDFRRDDLLLAVGSQITPAALSLIASAGLTEVSAYRRPRVAILSTGDELVEPGEDMRPDQIINSLALALAAMIRDWGGEAEYAGIARDHPDDVRAKISQACGADLLVTIGGASVGDHDHLRTVFLEMGGIAYFEKVAVKPGKPTWFGRLSDSLVLGLPGNPVSAMVMARLCLLPLLAGFGGIAKRPIFAKARLSVALPANGTRESFVRARYDPATGLAAPLDNQDSSAASALVAANCLIRRPGSAPGGAPGDEAQVLLLDHP